MKIKLNEPNKGTFPEWNSHNLLKLLIKATEMPLQERRSGTPSKWSRTSKAVVQPNIRASI